MPTGSALVRPLAWSFSSFLVLWSLSVLWLAHTGWPGVALWWPVPSLGVMLWSLRHLFLSRPLSAWRTASTIVWDHHVFTSLAQSDLPESLRTPWSFIVSLSVAVLFGGTMGVLHRWLFVDLSCATICWEIFLWRDQRQGFITIMTGTLATFSGSSPASPVLAPARLLWAPHSSHSSHSPAAFRS